MTVIKVSWESSLLMRDVVKNGVVIAGKKVISVGETTPIGVATVGLEGGVTILFGMNFSEQGKASLGFMNCVIERQIPDNVEDVKKNDAGKTEDEKKEDEKKDAIIRDLTAIVTTRLMVENQGAARNDLMQFSTERDADAWKDDVPQILAEIETKVNSNPGFITRALGEVRSGVSALTSVLPTHQVKEALRDAGVAISRGTRGLPGKDDVEKAASRVLGVVKEGAGALAGLAHRLLPSRRKPTGEGTEELAGDDVLKTKQQFEPQGDVPANKRPGSR